MTGLKRRYAAVAACVAVTIGWFTHPALTVSVVVMLLALLGAGVRWRHKRAGSAALVNRWTERSKKLHGLASQWMVLRSCSWWSLRRHSTVLRPSLKHVPYWTRWRTPIGELGTPIIRVGRVWLRTSGEEHTLTIGGPRTGKSGKVADLALSAPGAGLFASTGGDLYRNTAAQRAQLGPVMVFNPSDIGGVPSTTGFDLLAGCGDARAATDRAADLLSGTPISGTKKDPEWLELATSALASLLHAAALGGRTMHHVQMWVADPEAAAPEVMHHLKASPSPSTRMEAGQFLTNERPRNSICMLVMAALRWLADPHAVACTQRSSSLDVAELLDQRGTIYLIAKKNGTVTPLVTAFAGHVLREVRAIAEQRPGERLEPAFTFIPDEAPISCPLDLPVLTSDTGKYNISMHIVAQSFSQLRERWGENGAGTLLTNCATITAFGGTKDPAGLSTLTTLIGTHGGQAVLTPAQIQQLPKLHAVVFRNGILPVVGKPRMVWHRPDYRAAKRVAAWTGRKRAVQLVVRRVVWVLTSRRRVLTAPCKPMLALPPGRADQQASGGDRPGVGLTETRFDTEARRLINEALTRPGGNQ